MEFLSFQPEYWHWLVVALVLLCFEIIKPGLIFLWLLISTGCVAVVTYLMPDFDLSTQLLIFSSLSIASFIAWFLSVKMFPQSSDTDNQ